jgi:Ca2+-binding EF-hand superfamily protein
MVQAFQDEHEMHQLKYIFLAVDQDFAGSINKKELRALFDEFNMDLSPAEIERIFDSIYINGKHYITFLELKAGLLGNKFFTSEERLKRMFNYFDLDHNGRIDQEEIANCFKRFGRNLQ